MEKRPKTNQLVEALACGLLEQLQSKSYGKESLNNYRRILKNLALYMKDHGLAVYSSENGNAFIADYTFHHEISLSFQRFIKTVVERLNDYSEGREYYPQRKKAPVQLPENYTGILKEYLAFCKQDGNHAGNLTKKRKFCSDFLSFLLILECTDIRDMDSSHICKVYLMFKNKDAWAVIRMFLNYLYETGMVEQAYSAIVPHYTRPFVLPTIYSEDEILRFENAIDRASIIGIRNYAMLLLATRLGMRSGDIARLTFDEIDFESNSIHLIQGKTLQPLELPLLPNIKDAILNYIQNARPIVNAECHIFLRKNAPYQGITTSTLRFAATQYFRKAGIDISDKRHGVHTFRSSLASSMINDQVPYDVVRKVLGHTDPNAIKHYARIDIERLREYAIAVPEPSGVFEAFLNGGRSYAGI